MDGKNHACPFCNSVIPDIYETYRDTICYFGHADGFDNESTAFKNKFYIHMLLCPTCKEVSMIAEGKEKLENIIVPLYPKSLAKQFPDYIPLSIREDYEEAYSILNSSPKASATLSRRCLQSMIRDFWKVKGKSLCDEINAIKDKVTNAQWEAIDGVRSIGNIGAHMEKDVNLIIDIEPFEAERLIKLIELLIEKWYISKHEEEELYQTIKNISEEKKEQKKSKSTKD